MAGKFKNSKNEMVGKFENSNNEIVGKFKEEIAQIFQYSKRKSGRNFFRKWQKLAKSENFVAKKITRIVQEKSNGRNFKEKQWC